jgi:branched-chain amino acid transport system substrate-binding protein
MRTGWLARGCSCLAVAAALGGCSTATNSATSVSGTTLTVYASVPTQASDVLDAEKLALSQAGGTVGKFKVVLKSLPADTVKQIADNARTAIQDKTTIAYLGEVLPGTSEQSVPITNQLGILEVSPTDNALELTSSSPVVSGSQNTYYPSKGSYGYTFGQLTPSGLVEAQADVAQMRALGVTSLYVANDGSDYGRAIAHAVASDAKPLTVKSGPASAADVQSSGADAVFFGGTSASAKAAAAFLDAVASSVPKAKLFAPSGLATTAFASALAPGAGRAVYVSAPGYLPADLTPNGTAFETAFKAAYGHAPVPQAIFGFAAMKAILDTLTKAGTSATSRSVVVSDFLSLTVSQSVLGPFKINSSGDTSLAGSAFMFSRVRGGQLVPFKQATA